MLFPVVCFTCGMPIQQHQKKYYELVDKYTSQRDLYLTLPATETLINDLKEKFSSENSVKSFEENVISYSNQVNDAQVKQLAEKYRYTPEFRAMEELGISTKRYCCRRMFLCHPRELEKIII